MGFRLLCVGNSRFRLQFLLLLLEIAFDQDEFVFHAHFGHLFAVPWGLPSDVFGWCQIESLPLETTVVDTNIQACFLEVAIDDFRPRCAPAFDQIRVVPGTVLLAKTIGIDVAER